MPMLEISGLKKSFGSKEVLRGVNLTVAEHSVFGFIGKNGTGKTTTMKAILGLVKGDTGEIYVNGERVRYGNTPTNRFIGYLPDVPAFYPFMTAEEYLRFCGELCGMDRKTTRHRSEELLALVGLEGERHRIKGYSRGMKQRLGIAQALFHYPKLLICDEPTSALDPVGRKEILDILYNVRTQTTVLFSTHILSDVERICTEVALLNDGVVKRQGTLADLRGSRTSHRYRLEMANTVQANVLLTAFPEVESLDTRTLCFDETLQAPILQTIIDKNFGLVKFERLESSLESLFMEEVAS